jgi:uncharacterized protein
MPTIRDLVGAIRGRDGVEAAIVLGRDGLVIDGQTISPLDAEHVAAHVPSVVGAADELGRTAERGTLTTALLEYPGGLAIVSALSPEALLLVILSHHADAGPLLRDLRRHRAQIAALV